MSQTDTVMRMIQSHASLVDRMVAEGKAERVSYWPYLILKEGGSEALAAAGWTINDRISLEDLEDDIYVGVPGDKEKSLANYAKLWGIK